MVDRRLSARNWDPSIPLVSTKFQMVNGEQLEAGHPISTEVPERARMSMWLSRRAVYQGDFNPTPVVEAEDEQLTSAETVVNEPTVEVTGGAGGWYEVKASWRAEAERVHGKDKADVRAAELRVEGPPAEVYQQLEWGEFPAELDDWTPEQQAAFQAWFDAIPEGSALELDTGNEAVKDAWQVALSKKGGGDGSEG